MNLIKRPRATATLWITGLALALAAPSWASLTACPTTTGTTTLTAINTQGGCQAGDRQFTNFSITASTTSPDVAPTLSTVTLAASGAAGSTTNLLLDSSRFIAAASNGTTVATISYVVTVDTTVGGFLPINTIGIQLQNINSAGSADLQLSKSVCFGVSFTDFNSCVSNGGTVVTVSTDFAPNSAGVTNFTFPATPLLSSTFTNQTSVAIQETVSIFKQNNGKNNFISVQDLYDSIANTAVATPEPTSFLLSAIGLTGLVFLVRRRKSS